MTCEYQTPTTDAARDSFSCWSSSSQTWATDIAVAKTHLYIPHEWGTEQLNSHEGAKHHKSKTQVMPVTEGQNNLSITSARYLARENLTVYTTFIVSAWIELTPHSANR